MSRPISYHIVIDIHRSDLAKKENQHINNSSTTDYRLSDLTMISVDMNGSGAIGSNAQEKYSIAPNASIEPLKAKHIGYGVIRLYREPKELEEGAAVSADSPSANSENEDADSASLSKLRKHLSSTSLSSDSDGKVTISEHKPSSENTMLSILAVPSYFTATDILGFIGDEYTQDHISNARIIRSEISNRFLVLLNFRSRKHAKRFKKDYNGKLFNSMEPETCHVIYVKSVIFKQRDKSDNNYFLDDPFTTPDQPISTSLDKPVPPPTPSLQELPTCPVCLERMDSSITGLLTIPCQHTFHCQCLSKWQDDSCPICRYSSSRQHVKNLRRRTASSSTNNNPAQVSTSQSEPISQDKCAICGITDNLWICLVCGNIACGRYNHAHAIHHFEETGHCFSMDIETQRIWDYAGDNYVHRLLTTETDGKLVEFPSREGTSGLANGNGITADGEKSGKNASANTSYVEYSHILISQLESQREYYEFKLKEFADKYQALGEKNELIEKRMEMTTKTFSDRLALFEKKNEELAAITKKQSLANSQKVSQLAKAYQEEKVLSSGMLEKIKSLEAVNVRLITRLKESEAEKQDLSEQVKDLMFYLESQAKFKDAPEEVKQGTVVVNEPPAAPKSTSNKKKKKSK